jgi:hypothetical protein
MRGSRRFYDPRQRFPLETRKLFRDTIAVDPELRYFLPRRALRPKRKPNQEGRPRGPRYRIDPRSRHMGAVHSGAVQSSAVQRGPALPRFRGQRWFAGARDQEPMWDTTGLRAVARPARRVRKRYRRAYAGATNPQSQQNSTSVQNVTRAQTSVRDGVIAARMPLSAAQRVSPERKMLAAAGTGARRVSKPPVRLRGRRAGKQSLMPARSKYVGKKVRSPRGFAGG